MPEKVADCKYEKAVLHMTDLVKFSEKDVNDRGVLKGESFIKYVYKIPKVDSQG